MDQRRHDAPHHHKASDTYATINFDYLELGTKVLIRATELPTGS